MSLEVMTDDSLNALAARARRAVVRIGHDAGGQGAHFGPALSLVEIMTALYGIAVRHSPTDRLSPNRDRVILSKGHGSLALYTVLHEYGYIDAEVLATAERDGSPLPGQPIRNRELGIEFSSGSLGMGLSFGVGLALSARMMSSNRSIFVIMGDGETNEGSVWEAATSAAHYQLGSLTAIVDVNDLQSDGLTSQVMSGDLHAIWRGFGWDVVELDGHSISELRAAFALPMNSVPRCILAHTIKGKGISFMEGVPEWHYGRMTDSQFATAALEVHLGDVIQ
jgi:transketolase